MTRRRLHGRTFLTTAEAHEGLHVLFVGEATGPLMELHPGVISHFWGPGLNHCVVSFIGVDDGPDGFASGFDHDRDGMYPGLLLPEAPQEWEDLAKEVWADGP